MSHDDSSFLMRSYLYIYLLFLLQNFSAVVVLLSSQQHRNSPQKHGQKKAHLFHLLFSAMLHAQVPGLIKSGRLHHFICKTRGLTTWSMKKKRALRWFKNTCEVAFDQFESWILSDWFEYQNMTQILPSFAEAPKCDSDPLTIRSKETPGWKFSCEITPYN